MKTIKIIILIIIFTIAVTAQGQNSAESNTLDAVKINSSITLNGSLTDAEWQRAKPVELKYEIRPGDNSPATHKTLVRALYDDENIYFGFECYDPQPKEIRANLSDRDKIFGDDIIVIAIDTYRDFQKAYEFAVNPYGIQGDLLASSSGEDESVNYIWYSAAELNDNGWTAVMSIPFSSLTFPDEDEQTWGLHIVRTIPRSSRIQVSWMPIDRDIPSFFTQAGALTGLKNIKSGSSFEILPYAIGQKMGNLAVPGDAGSGIKFNPIEGRIGGGIKYSPSTNFSLDAVINPDFSQIESDADQISVNTTFALYYPEKRPFFLNGRELLQTPMYYSRSINNPLGAARVIGKSGSLSYMYMGAYDRNTVIVVPGEEQSNTVATSLKSFANIGRLRYDFEDEAYVGLMLLSRNLSGGHNYLIGFDWNYKFWGNWYFNGEGFLSQTKELNESSIFSSTRKFGESDYTAGFDGEQYSGSGLHMVLSHSQRSFNFVLVSNTFSPTFQTYNGLFSSTGFQEWFANGEYIFYPEDSFIDRGEFGVRGSTRYSTAGVEKELTLTPFVALNMKGQIFVNASYLLVNRERFFGVQFDKINRGMFYFSARPWDELSFSLNGSVGRFIYRSSTPTWGTGHNIGAGVTVKPTSNIDISFSYNRANLADSETGNLFYDGNIYRAVGIYQFTHEAFFRTIFQYNSFSKSFNIYPLFSYKLNAFTTFYAGANSDYIDWDSEFGVVNVGQQYFLKMQYLWQM